MIPGMAFFLPGDLLSHNQHPSIWLKSISTTHIPDNRCYRRGAALCVFPQEIHHTYGVALEEKQPAQHCSVHRCPDLGPRTWLPDHCAAPLRQIEVAAVLPHGEPLLLSQCVFLAKCGCDLSLGLALHRINTGLHSAYPAETSPSPPHFSGLLVELACFGMNFHIKLFLLVHSQAL